ncbi:amylo-alpha-1,6-glucosidase [Acidobacteriota bacterium]
MISKNKTPYFAIFITLILISHTLHTEIYYPWKDVYIGALEGKNWAGLVFVPQNESAFGFRMRIKKGIEIAEGMDLSYLIAEVGPHSPDGQYARLKFDLGLPFGKGTETPILKKPSSKSDTLVFEWSRQDEKTLVGKISIPDNIELHLIHYFPWNFVGKYRLHPDGGIKGENYSQKKYHYIHWTSHKGDLIADDQEEELTVSFNKEEKIYFVSGVGEEENILENHIYRYKNERTIDSILQEEQKRYQKKRAQVEGFYEGVARAITNNLFWMTLYQPGKHRLYSPAGRSWVFPEAEGSSDFWTIYKGDSFFNAIEVSIESTKYAEDILKSVLETQYPNGNIPNWRSPYGGTPDRSQAPLGSYAVLKVFQKNGNMELLKYAFPYLKKWHSFWKAKKRNGQARRDGNGDGLLEWGSDIELLVKEAVSGEKNSSGKIRAIWESGQNDLPNWNAAGFSTETNTLMMNCLDLNSLYTLDAWCLAQIANILDEGNESKKYLEEYEKMKELVNVYFWNEKEGFYFDRLWDGQFSIRKAASNFYPLLARIPDQNKALRMVKHLLNEEEFWGEYVIPTVSRDDPAFKEQQFWQGSVKALTNYLIYQGLKANGFDAVASELAQKSSNLFLRVWENFQLCPGNLDSRTGEAGEQRFQSWGPLFALIGLEEFLDFTPWEGFRFGILKPEKKGRLSRVSIQGRHYDLEISSSKMSLKEEGKQILEANGGAVFRHFLYSESEVSFEIKSLRQRELKIQFLTEGKYQVMVDNQVTKVFSGKSVKIKIPEGEHTVLLLLLERKE